MIILRMMTDGFSEAQPVSHYGVIDRKHQVCGHDQNLQSFLLHAISRLPMICTEPVRKISVSDDCE